MESGFMRSFTQSTASTITSLKELRPSPGEAAEVAEAIESYWAAEKMTIPQSASGEVDARPALVCAYVGWALHELDFEYELAMSFVADNVDNVLQSLACGRSLLAIARTFAAELTD